MAVEVKRNRKHAPKRVRLRSGKDKKSPNSIREVLNSIRECSGPNGGIATHQSFVEMLDAAWRGPRYGIHSVTRSVFERTEDGTHNLSYAHLEMYARVCGAPVALLLLVSRINAELRSADAERAREVLNGMRAAINEAERYLDGKTLDRSQVSKVLSSYRQAGGPAMSDVL